MSHPAPAKHTFVGGRLASRVYEGVKSSLIEGRWERGSMLFVTEIREEYGVSKQPVMDALRALATDRLVQIQPQVGVTVSDYSPDEVAAFQWLFARSEGAIAHLAAQRRSEIQLIELESACARLEGLTAIETDLVRGQEYRRGNRAVHEVVHAMSTSALTADISRQLWDLSDFLISTHGGTEAIGRQLEERNHGHRDLLEALREGDPVAAEQAMITHILDTPLSPSGATRLSELPSTETG